jgi:hypothetical protein
MGIDGTDLLDEHARRLTGHLHLGSELRGTGASRRRDDDDNRARQEFISLLVLKRCRGPYLPGQRTTAWRKVRCEQWTKHRRRRLPT